MNHSFYKSMNATENAMITIKTGNEKTVSCKYFDCQPKPPSKLEQIYSLPSALTTLPRLESLHSTHCEMTAVCNKQNERITANANPTNFISYTFLCSTYVWTQNSSLNHTNVLTATRLYNSAGTLARIHSPSWQI